MPASTTDTPLYAEVVEEYGDPDDIDPTPTLDDLLARHPREVRK